MTPENQAADLTTPHPVVYGVDFGTSTSSLAIIDRRGERHLVTDPVDDRTAIPSAVFRRPDGTLLFGRAALNASGGDPLAFLDSMKLRMEAGRTLSLGPGSYPVADLLAALLGFLRERAEALVAGPPDITVLTAPVGWAGPRRRVLEEAAVRAGFPRASIRVLDEPAAALIAAQDDGLITPEDTVLVYDLGGGTLDCALFKPGRSADGGADIRATGSRPIGGVSFDERLSHLAQASFPDEIGAAVAESQPPEEEWRRGRLRAECERLKEELSESPSAWPLLTGLTGPVPFTVTRAEFEELIGADVDETVRCCAELLRGAGMRWADVTRVVLVGGSTRVPLVRARLEAEAPGRVVLPRERELAVVRGAASFALQEALQRIEHSRPVVRTAPSRLFVPPSFAVPPLVTGRAQPTVYRRPVRGAVLWCFALLWLVLAGLAARHWTAPSAALLAAVGAVHALGILRQSTRPYSALGVTLAVLTALGGALFVLPGIGLGRRVLHEPTSGWAWTALLAALLAALVSAVQRADADEAATSARAAERDDELVARLASPWSGVDGSPGRGAPPQFMARLFDLPAMRGFELRTGQYHFALVAGRRVALVAMLGEGEAVPEFGAASAEWRARLDARHVRLMIVVPGLTLPEVPADRAIAEDLPPRSTTGAFADTIGGWLAAENELHLPTIRKVIGQ